MKTGSLNDLLYILIKIASAVLAGVILGYPSRDRPGGLRTHVLVVMGATLFCSIGLQYISQNDDILRVIQGLISGIGFIGAATVLKLGGTIAGVNTAASILNAAAIGCFIGLWDPLLSLILAMAVALVNFLIKIMEDRVIKKNDRRKIIDNK